MIEIADRPAAGATIRLHANDNVVVARTDIAIGARLEPDGLVSRSQVAAGHKIAARAITKGEPIRKYDVIIGFAAADIPAGTLVHSHNMEFREFDRDYAYAQDYRPVEMLPEARARDLHGHRARERAGRDPQLHRHPVDRQLLGDGGAQDRRVVHAGAAGGVSERRRRRRLRPRHGLRHGNDRRADGPAAPHAGRLRAPRQSRRLSGRRARLRAQPDLAGCSRTQGLVDGAAPALVRDAGDRRHAQDHRGRHRGDQARCCPRPTA